jgi:hypothetical protein
MSCFFVDRIDSSNREDIQDKYIQAIIAHMDFMEIRESLRDYIYKEKNQLSDKNLYKEIKKQNPEILREMFQEDFIDTLTEKW